MLVGAAVFGIALVVSDDLRLLYVSGALLFAFAAFLLSAPAREDLIAAALLVFASTFLFASFVLPQTPFLWPTLLLWVAIVVWLLFRKRFSRIVTIVGAMILIAGSAWYCAFYIPVQMQRMLTHVGNGAAPPFTLQLIGQNPVPTRSTPGKILVLDFFATWCSPCIAELPELERIRADLQTRRDIEFVLVGTNKGGDTPDRVRTFAQHRHVSLPGRI
jgi:thiol:disulfide interchange protein